MIKPEIDIETRNQHWDTQVGATLEDGDGARFSAERCSYLKHVIYWSLTITYYVGKGCQIDIQIGSYWPKWDKSGTCFRYVSVHFG